MTLQDDNKKIVEDYFEICWNQGNLDHGKNCIAEDYDFHMPDAAADFPRGLAGWRAGVGEYLKAFPDCHWDVRQILAEGDMVAVRTVWTGTHSADYMGIPATGKRIESANFDLYILKDGLMVEHWDIPDYMAQLKQLGGLPEEVGNMYAGATEG